MHPCFFISGPAGATLARAELATLLNEPEALDLRGRIRGGGAKECRTCVCSLWQPPGRPISERLAERTRV
jgi:hypothetical protein